MNRKDIFKLAEMAISQVSYTEGMMSVKEIAKIIHDWRVKNNYPKNMIPEVVDGFLYLNNDPVTRIAARLPKVAYSENAAYWEGRILKKQEMYYD